MAEISEKERAKRKATRDADNTIPAQSFRLGQDVRDNLLKIANRRGLSQADLIRDLITKESKRLFG